MRGRTHVPLNRLVIVMNRLVMQAAVGGIDVVDLLGNLGRQMHRVRWRRRCDLDQHHFAAPLGKAPEKLLESSQLCRWSDFSLSIL